MTFQEFLRLKEAYLEAIEAERKARIHRLKAVDNKDILAATRVQLQARKRMDEIWEALGINAPAANTSPEEGLFFIGNFKRKSRGVTPQLL